MNIYSILAEFVACDEDSDFPCGLADGADIDGCEQSGRLRKALDAARTTLSEQGTVTVDRLQREAALYESQGSSEGKYAAYVLRSIAGKAA